LFAGSDKADILVHIRLQRAIFRLSLFAGRQGTIWRDGLVHSVWHACNQSCRVHCRGVSICASWSVHLHSDAGFFRPPAKWQTLVKKEAGVNAVGDRN